MHCRAANGKQLVHDGIDCQLTSDERHCRLLIPVSKRSDTGWYDVKAANVHGEAAAKIKITVVGE